MPSPGPPFSTSTPTTPSRKAKKLSLPNSVALRHAIRAAAGHSILALLALSTTATSGCLSSLIFLISTIAGTPENLQGFQLRSASLTFAGALLGIISFSIVHLIASTHALSTFAAAIPFILFFSSLRPHPKITPLPTVANVVLGLLTISHFPSSRARLKSILPPAFIDATLGWFVAVLVNLLLPDRASDVGRRIIATHFTTLGATISQVATQTLSFPPSNSTNSDSSHFHSNPQQSNRNLSLSTLPNFTHHHPLLFNYPHIPSAHSHRPPLGRTRTMLRDAKQSLAFFGSLPPLSSEHLSNFANLSTAARFFEASRYEPSLLPSASARWRNPDAWQTLVNRLQALGAKVSSLESAAAVTQAQTMFMREKVVAFLGEAYVPLWIAHFASCATACAAMSIAMRSATCENMFHLDQHREDAHLLLHQDIDPRKWQRRRAEMYIGFLTRYKLKILSSSVNNAMRAITDSSIKTTKAITDSHPDFALPAYLYDEAGQHDHATFLEMLDESHDGRTLSMAQCQSLSFLCITAQAMCEEITHVQQAMVDLASSRHRRTLFAPFRFLVGALPLLVERVKQIFNRNVHAWEVRFALTHSLLLLFILGFALFAGLRERFEASEIAWVFTSAALAAQLSAEPTLFIGAIRVFATLLGALLAFGFNSALSAMGRLDKPALNYIIVPYKFIITFVFLRIAPSKYRYAAFLIIATNTILLFCPRSTPLCNSVLSKLTSDCFPNWEYAVSRAANVSIGVVLALIFHLLVWPRFANEVALRALSRSFLNSSRLIAKLNRTYFSFGMQPKAGTASARMSKKRNNNAPRIEVVMSEGDLYNRNEIVLEEIQKRVSDHIAFAVFTVNSEAGVCGIGPFRLSKLLSGLLKEFIYLNLTLTEMAALLGRRPIFNDSYGPSVYHHLIRPVLPLYETIHVSLNNLVGCSERAMVPPRGPESRLLELVSDLREGVAHLARVRRTLRRLAARRLSDFEKHMKQSMRLTSNRSVVSEHMVRRFSWSLSVDAPLSGELLPRRQLSEGGYAARNWCESKEICVDDIVLYNAFCFVTDQCLSAFVRISATIMEDLECKIVAIRAKRKRREERRNGGGR